MMPQQLKSQTVTWDVANANNEWNTTSNNWTGGATFANGNAAVFNAATGEAVTVVAGGVAPSTTTVGANDGNWTFSGGSILGGTLSKSGTGSLTLNAANGFSSTTISNGPASQTTAAIVLGDNAALGTGPVTLANTGAMTALFNGSSSRTIANNIALGGSAVVTRLLAGNATTLQLDGILSGGVSGSNLRIDTNQGAGSTGLVKLTNASNSFTGTIQLNRGGLAITSDGALGNSANTIFFDIGTNTQIGLRFDAAMSSNRNISLGNGRQIFDTVNNNVTLGGAITASGTGNLYKIGSGVLTLNSGSNTFANSTIAGGSIAIGNAAALGAGSVTFATTGNAMLQTTALSGAVTLANNIVLNNPAAAGNLGILAKGGTGNSLQINGVISGGGANTTLFLNTDVFSDVTGKFILNNANTYTGNTYINRGSVQLNDAAGFGTSAVRFDSNLNAVLSFNSPMTVTNNISYTFAAKRIDTGSNDVTLSGVQNLVVPITKEGTGKLTLTNINTGNSSLIVSEGTLELADDAQLRFVLGATSGTNNQLSGAGTAILDGDFNIVTTAADSLSSGTWLLENVPSLTGPYGETFSVVGFTHAGDNKWTKSIGGGKTYTFDETTGTLTLATAGFESWIADKGLTGPDAEFDADPDNDGVANGLEFILGGEPNPATEGSNSLALLPQVSVIDGDLTFSFNRKDLSENATSLVFQWSTDLSFSSPANDVPVGATSSSVDGISVAITEDAPDAETDTIIITVPAAKAVAGRMFGRLRAVSNP